MKQKIPRREFIGTGLMAAVLAGCDRQERAKKPPLDARFTYDISKYEHTDPALLLYDEKTRFATGLNEPKCLAVAGDTILVGGDKTLKTFDSTGKLLGARELPALPHAVTAGGRVAFKDRFEGSESFGDRAHLTAIAQTGDSIYVADAGNREVLRCDLSGKIVTRIKGFVVPSPYFDLNVGADGVLWVTNPGKHRIEAYTLDGKCETGWGATAMNVEGFCGCCNPVYFTRLPDGRFVTSEKGLNRVKVYDLHGKFECVVAGPEQLIKDRELARKACKDCQIGFGMPVAADARGRLLVLDTATRDVRIFERKEKNA
jgi:hypothetical protein